MTARGRPPAVLVVDDEPDHAVIVRELLAMAEPGLAVELVGGAVEARAAAAEPARASLPPAIVEAPAGALVLVDRLLAGYDCYPIVDVCARERPDLTLVVLSAALPEEERRRALSAGAHEAAEKPGTLTEWRGLLGRLLALSVTRIGAR